MRKQSMSKEEVSSFCMELSLLLHAGLGIGDGLYLMAEDAGDAWKSTLKQLAEQTDAGGSLSAAMRESGVFPEYVCTLTDCGEKTGKMEEALRALSEYYQEMERLERQLRSALLYPAVLLLLMLLVITVLLTKVLPIFNDVFLSLGSRLTGVAGGLLAVGNALDAAMPVLLVLLAVVVLGMAALSLSDTLREKLLRTWRSGPGGDRGINRHVSTARFGQALSMGLSAGLPLEDAVELAGGFQKENPAAQQRCRDCRTRLERGENLAEALRGSGVLSPAYCRMLALGIRSGSGDTVMEEIARRLSEDCEAEISRKVGRVEPTIVVATSILVGMILLSVMLPLMNIMAAIG